MGSYGQQYAHVFVHFDIRATTVDSRPASGRATESDRGQIRVISQAHRVSLVRSTVEGEQIKMLTAMPHGALRPGHEAVQSSTSILVSIMKKMIVYE